MKAITRRKYGNPDVIEVQELEKPKPKDNEVLVNVKYTTINRTDCGVLTGKPFIFRFFVGGLLKPKTPTLGTDFSGEIEAIGDKVKNFNVGDRVWGLSDEGFASQAEFMCLNENKGLALIPDNTPYDQIVACAEGAHYAYNFLNKLNLSKHHKVIVNGATGAIGSAALQMLKSQGIYVTAIGNTKNIELLKSLGANKVYNYETEDFTEIDKDKYDFVFDAVGKSSFGNCKKLLVDKGIYISSELGPNSENLYLPLLTKIKGNKRVIFPFPSDCKRSLLYVNELLEKGLFKAVIDKTYPPEEAQDAYRYVMTGEKTGNVIIKFD